MPPVQSFARICKLPHEQRDGAKSQARHFSRSLRDVVMKVDPEGGASMPQTDSDFSTDIQVAGHVIEVRAIFGQNMAMKDGVTAKFFSYSVSMDLRSPAVERVTYAAGAARWLGLPVGAAAGFALYWVLYFFLAKQSGGLTIGKLFQVGLPLGGAFAGWKVGQVIQGMAEAGAEKISKGVGGYDQAISAFGQLTADVDLVLAGTPKA